MTTETNERLRIEPMDPQVTDIQPGGGVIIKLEKSWGYVRRRYLKTFHRGYVARMKQLRKGDKGITMHEVLDPRDLKFYRNQNGYYWDESDDPFTWRDNLPFVRDGLAELIVFSLFTFGGAASLTCLSLSLGWTGIVAVFGWLGVTALCVFGLLVVWFFRNPNRVIPQGDGLVVSPADGKVVVIEEIEHSEFVGGPAVLIGVFLSIFNVHVNRMPIAARVIGLTYKPGKFLNAMRPESAWENEQLAIRIEGNDPPHRRMIVRQISGAIARRIVCRLKPGDEQEQGKPFGMIKLGSRTELVLPREAGLELKVQIGAKVNAGSSVLAEYKSST